MGSRRQGPVGQLLLPGLADSVPGQHCTQTSEKGLCTQVVRCALGQRVPPPIQPRCQVHAGEQAPRNDRPRLAGLKQMHLCLNPGMQ